MAFQENKPQPPQSERGEIQKQAPESQEQRKESFGDKIKRFAGKIGERLSQFGKRRQSAESVMKSVNPEATFTLQEQEQLTSVESAAQTETAKATEALQALETAEPAAESTTNTETSGDEASSSQESLPKTEISAEKQKEIDKTQAELKNVNGLLKYCDDELQQSTAKYEQLTKSAKDPNNVVSTRHQDFIRAQDNLNMKNHWQESVDGYKAQVLRLEARLRELQH